MLDRYSGASSSHVSIAYNVSSALFTVRVPSSTHLIYSNTLPFSMDVAIYINLRVVKDNLSRDTLRNDINSREPYTEVPGSSETSAAIQEIEIV